MSGTLCRTLVRFLRSLRLPDHRTTCGSTTMAEHRILMYIVCMKWLKVLQRHNLNLQYGMQCDTIWYSQYSQDSANFCFLQSAGCDWGFRCSIFLDHVFVGETPATNVQPKPCSRDLPVAHRLKVRGVPARGALESTALTCASLQGSLA